MATRLLGVRNSQRPHHTSEPAATNSVLVRVRALDGGHVTVASQLLVLCHQHSQVVEGPGHQETERGLSKHWACAKLALGRRVQEVHAVCV